MNAKSMYMEGQLYLHSINWQTKKKRKIKNAISHDVDVTSLDYMGATAVWPPSPLPVLRPGNAGAASTTSSPNQHCPKGDSRHGSGFTHSCLHSKGAAVALSPLHVRKADGGECRVY